MSSKLYVTAFNKTGTEIEALTINGVCIVKPKETVTVEEYNVEHSPLYNNLAKRGFIISFTENKVEFPKVEVEEVTTELYVEPETTVTDEVPEQEPEEVKDVNIDKTETEPEDVPKKKPATRGRKKADVKVENKEGDA